MFQHFNVCKRQLKPTGSTHCLKQAMVDLLLLINGIVFVLFVSFLSFLLLGSDDDFLYNNTLSRLVGGGMELGVPPPFFVCLELFDSASFYCYSFMGLGKMLPW